MKCQICGKDAVISTFNGSFCREHFIENFENNVLSTIERYKLIEAGEKIAIANSGGKDSLSLLLILSKYFKKNHLVSITVNEGIAGYRDKTIEKARYYSEKFGVEFKVYSYEDLIGSTMDEVVKQIKAIPCSICGTLRRYLLNLAALNEGADKLATAHNLDDEVESIVMNMIQNNFESFLRLGPISGIIRDKGFVVKIKPLIFISEKETALYAMLNGLETVNERCPYADIGLRSLVSTEIKRLESNHPGAKKSIIENTIKFKENFSDLSVKPLKHCKICGAPSSEDICEVCKIKALIGK